MKINNQIVDMDNLRFLLQVGASWEDREFLVSSMILAVLALIESKYFLDTS